jgi:hypothetical protein
VFGHSNGALLWNIPGAPGTRTMGDSAIWLTSSCPSFGKIEHDWEFGGCFTLGQHAQCISFDPRAVPVAAAITPVVAQWRRWTNNGIIPVDGIIVANHGNSQIEMIALHLMYRRVRILLNARKCSAGLDNTYPRSRRLCTIATTGDIDNSPEALTAQWLDSYVLYSVIDTATKRFSIFSKKHAKPDVWGEASLWDDIVVPMLPGMLSNSNA